MGMESIPQKKTRGFAKLGEQVWWKRKGEIRHGGLEEELLRIPAGLRVVHFLPGSTPQDPNVPLGR